MKIERTDRREKNEEDENKENVMYINGCKEGCH
jgi:hypothetical protein